MTKIKLLFLCMLCTTSLLAQDSQTSTRQLDKFFIEGSVLGTFKQHDIKTFGLQLNVGYDVLPKFHVFATCEGTTSLLDKENLKTYAETNILGGGIGYSLFRDPKGGIVDIRAMLGTSIGNVDWKQTTYGIGFQWKILKGVSPILGLGYRHVNSRTSSMPDMNVVYGTIGISL